MEGGRSLEPDGLEKSKSLLGYEFSRPTPRTEFLNGVKAELPLLVGVIPFGMIYGVLALDAGIPALAAQAMSCIIFAGSSQFITTQLYLLGTPGIVMWLSVAVINLRHALYSASVAPFLKGLNYKWKMSLAYLLTDEAYAVTIVHYFKQREPSTAISKEYSLNYENKHWFFFGSGLTLWTSWQLSTAAGIIMGAVVPETWALDFTLTLIFIAMITGFIKDRADLAAALIAGILATFFTWLPYKLNIVLACMAGIAAGLILEPKK